MKPGKTRSTLKAKSQKAKRQKRVVRKPSSNPESTINEKWLTQEDFDRMMIGKTPQDISGQVYNDMQRLYCGLTHLIKHPDYWDGNLERATSHLFQLTHWLKTFIKELGKNGNQDALNLAWYTATDFGFFIDEIARSKPEMLREIASEALFMPSLRAKPRGFMTDWEDIAKAIGLSEKSVLKMGKKALHQLHAPVTLFVARWVEFVERARRIIDVDDCTPEERFYHQLGLPDYNSTTWGIWFRAGLVPYIDKGTAREDIRGTRLEAELLKASPYNAKDYRMRDELKRRCRSPLESLAPPAPLSAKPLTL